MSLAFGEQQMFAKVIVLVLQLLPVLIQRGVSNLMAVVWLVSEFMLVAEGLPMVLSVLQIHQMPLEFLEMSHL